MGSRTGGYDIQGMVNKGACRMLLIKCYLATGRFAEAEQQADILIDQSGYELMKTISGLLLIRILLKHGRLRVM